MQTEQRRIALGFHHEGGLVSDKVVHVTREHDVPGMTIATVVLARDRQLKPDRAFGHLHENAAPTRKALAPYFCHHGPARLQGRRRQDIADVPAHEVNG